MVTYAQIKRERPGRITLLAIVCLLFGFVFVSPLSSQPKTAKPQPIVILVTDPSGAPISNAKVQLDPLGKLAPKNLSTDAEGRLALNIPPGVYSLVVTSEGFEPSTRRIPVQSSGNQIIRVVLRPWMCPESAPCPGVITAS
jgi:hypothetical protein